MGAGAALWLASWLVIGGHADIGPIFGRLQPGGKGMLQAHHTVQGVGMEDDGEYWVTEDGTRVSFTSAQVSKLLTKLITRTIKLDDGKTPLLSVSFSLFSFYDRVFCVFLAYKGRDRELLNGTPHGLLRVSGVQWAARCAGDVAATQACIAGRWADESSEFKRYWGRGAAKRAKYLATNTRDPILDFKPWPPGGMTYQGSARRGVLFGVGFGSLCFSLHHARAHTR